VTALGVPHILDAAARIALAGPWVERVAEAVREQEDAEHRDEDHETGRVD
jgi:hypothetical protein